MDLIAEQIRQQISMFDVLERYGFETGRAGVLPCPFHQDDRPSFKAYSGAGGWHCYGCNTGGSVIDFVMRLFGIGFGQAVLRLDNDFHMGMTGKRPDARALKKLAAERFEKERRQQGRDIQYGKLWTRYAMIDKALNRCKPTDSTAGLYAALMARLEHIWNSIEELQGQKDGR